jgi:hypothetical protein
VVVLALALPAAAFATWTHKGQGELKENVEVTLSGELSVNTEVGKVTCPTSIGTTLTGKSSSGTVDSYAVSEPSKCDLTESLGAVCGTHGVSKVVKTGSWELTGKETSIEISSLDLEFQLGKCLIPALRIKGTATATPDKSFAMSTLTLSGSQTLYNTLEEEVGSANLTGTPSVSPPATYGVKTAPLVETGWLMEDEPLGEYGELTLEGEFAFSYSGGSIGCQAVAVLALTPGEVEEEEPEGEAESFVVSEPASCVAGGALKTLCGENPVKSVEKTGAWSLNANEEDISVSGLALDYEFKECAITSLRLEGNATLSAEEPTAITATSFSGETAIYNSEEEEIGAAELAGSQSASPPGTFQLRETGLPSEPIWIETAEGFPTSFTVSGETSHPGKILQLICESSTGSGQVNTWKTGTAVIAFHGCKEYFFGTKCTSTGQSSGTIVTPELHFHLVTVEHSEGERTPAMLLTANKEMFLSYKCGLGLSVEVVGNGILGDITSPAYYEPSSTIVLHFASKSSEQEFSETSEGEGTEYQLEETESLFEQSGPYVLEAEFTLSFENEVQLNE